MGWPLLGQWDRETTPPGASVADLPAVIASLCKALNLRRKYSLYSAGNPIGDEIAFTYKQGSTSTYPTASDLTPTIGTRNAVNGPIVRGILSDLIDGLEELVDNSPSPKFWKSSSFNTGVWSYSDLIAYASTGLSAFDLNAPVTQADNWLILKRSLDQLRYLRMGSQVTVETSTTLSANDTNLADALPDPPRPFVPDTIPVQSMIDCDKSVSSPSGYPFVKVSPNVSSQCLSWVKTYKINSFIGTLLHAPYTVSMDPVNIINDVSWGGGTIAPIQSSSYTGTPASGATMTLTISLDPNASGDFLLEGDAPGNDYDDGNPLWAVAGSANFLSALGESPAPNSPLWYIDFGPTIEALL